MVKVDRAILAGAATVQFASLVLLRDHRTYLLGAVLGTVTGTILLLLALGIQPRPREHSREAP
jgi:hypothetical protein